MTEIVWVVDSKTDRVHPYVDNGVFYDGRKKALNIAAKTQETQAKNPPKRKKPPTRSKNITQFTIKEDHHYNEWMKR